MIGNRLFGIVPKPPGPQPQQLSALELTAKQQPPPPTESEPTALLVDLSIEDEAGELAGESLPDEPSTAKRQQTPPSSQALSVKPAVSQLTANSATSGGGGGYVPRVNQKQFASRADKLAGRARPGR